jgi:serine/threonine protein kinase
MAPELFNQGGDRGDYGDKVDIYALGITIWAMYSGRMPGLKASMSPMQFLMLVRELRSQQAIRSDELPPPPSPPFELNSPGQQRSTPVHSQGHAVRFGSAHTILLELGSG